MLDSIVIAATIAATFLIVLFAQRVNTKRRYPPGPKGYPIIGNAHQLELEFVWLYYAKLKKKYGLLP